MRPKIDLSRDVLLTADEFARMIRSTTASVRVLTSRRRIPREVVVKIGRRTLYSRAAAEEWLTRLQGVAP